MNNFSFAIARSVEGAVTEVAATANAKFIAGGTNLLDLMKENVSRPSHLVDITRLPLDRIVETPEGGLRLGALATNAETYSVRFRFLIFIACRARRRRSIPIWPPTR